MRAKKNARIRRKFYVQCESSHYSIIRSNQTRTAGGPCSLDCNMANLPHIPGLRYKVTFELIGADKQTRPQLLDFVPRYCWTINPKEARRRMRNFPTAACRNYMRIIIKEWELAKKTYKQSLKVWRSAKKLTFSQTIPICEGSTFDSEKDSYPENE